MAKKSTINRIERKDAKEMGVKLNRKELWLHPDVLSELDRRAKANGFRATKTLIETICANIARLSEKDFKSIKNIWEQK